MDWFSMRLLLMSPDVCHSFSIEQKNYSNFTRKKDKTSQDTIRGDWPWFNTKCLSLQCVFLEYSWNSFGRCPVSGFRWSLEIDIRRIFRVEKRGEEKNVDKFKKSFLTRLRFFNKYYIIVIGPGAAMRKTNKNKFRVEELVIFYRWCNLMKYLEYSS